MLVASLAKLFAFDDVVGWLAGRVGIVHFVAAAFVAVGCLLQGLTVVWYWKAGRSAAFTVRCIALAVAIVAIDLGIGGNDCICFGGMEPPMIVKYCLLSCGFVGLLRKDFRSGWLTRACLIAMGSRVGLMAMLLRGFNNDDAAWAVDEIKRLSWVGGAGDVLVVIVRSGCSQCSRVFRALSENDDGSRRILAYNKDDRGTRTSFNGPWQILELERDVWWAMVAKSMPTCVRFRKPNGTVRLGCFSR